MKRKYLLLLLSLCLITLALAQKEFGSKESAKWTATTTESATNDAQKQWLAKGKPGTITGEVVDVSCYMQLGKTGEKHIDCGSKCVRAGQPIGVLTAQKELYLVMPEEHHPRRDGQISLRDAFAEQMGKQVKVTGMIQRNKQGKSIFVSTMEKVNKPQVSGNNGRGTWGTRNEKERVPIGRASTFTRY